MRGINYTKLASKENIKNLINPFATATYECVAKDINVNVVPINYSSMIYFETFASELIENIEEMYLHYL